MALFKYYKKTEKKTPTSTTVTPCLPTKVDSLSEAQIQKVNNHIWETVGNGAISCGKQQHHYYKYSAKERANIGKYAIENGATKACRHFTRTLVRISALPKKVSRWPLLLGEDLDATVGEFVESLGKVGGIANTSIVMAAEEGIVAAKNPSLLVAHGGHI